MEDVVFGLDRGMTCVSAVGGALGVGRELVRWGIVVEDRVSPTSACRKSPAVLFHDESLAKGVGHIDVEGGLGALLLRPLELHDHGAIRKSAAVARNAVL